MSGVWFFKNGVVRLVENPGGDGGGGGRRKILVNVGTNEVITSYEMLERQLGELGWERYRRDPSLVQFHRPTSVHLISLPGEFTQLRSVHMYDIVVQTRNAFEVRDV